MKPHTTGPVAYQFKFRKVLAALVYFASQPQIVTNLDKYKAIKLLFLADKDYFVRYGRPIFGDFYRALEHGAVPQRTLDRLNNLAAHRTQGAENERLAKSLKFVKIDSWEYPVLVAKAAPDFDALSELELKYLHSVAVKHGRKSFDALKKLSHTKAWHKAWDARPKGVDAVNMAYEDFFEGEPEALEGAREQMMGGA